MHLEAQHPELFRLQCDNTARLDERPVEVQHATIRRVLPHMRVCDIADTVVRRVLEHVVEISDQSTLSSAVLAKHTNAGSDIPLMGVLPSALAAMSELLAAVAASRGETVCSDDEPPASPAVVITAPACVAPTPLDTSSANAWRNALADLKGEELALLAARYDVRVASSKAGTVDALAADSVRFAVPHDEQPLPWPVTADELTKCTRDQLSVWCRRAKLAAHGTKPELVERLCAAAGAELPPRAPASADDMQKQREQRTWRTPLFGVLGVRQLPLAYRFSDHPPTHQRVHCRAAACALAVDDANVQFVRAACGCCYHDCGACRPASGHCDACLDSVLALARVHGAARNKAVETAVQQLVTGDDSVAGGDDDDEHSDEETDVDRGGDDDALADAADPAAAKMTAADVRKALGAALKLCSTLK